MRYVFTVLAVLAVQLQLSNAHAADPALKCRIGELKAAVKYGRCRAGAENAALKASVTPDFFKCVTKFSRKWDKLESRGSCPSTNTFLIVESEVAEHVTKMFDLLATGPSIVCAFPATGQVTSFGPTDDGDVQAGSPLGYHDNGNRTITDLNTGLMWETKHAKLGIYGFYDTVQCTSESGSCADPHFVGNRYTWAAGFQTFNGSLVNIFLEQLNDRCHANPQHPCSTNSDCVSVGGACGFAGYRDWRVPNQKELLTIADYSGFQYAGARAIHPAFFNEPYCLRDCRSVDTGCSCTADAYHWSSTTYQRNSTEAWQLEYTSGRAQTLSKQSFGAVRAVRGGL